MIVKVNHLNCPFGTTCNDVGNPDMCTCARAVLDKNGQEDKALRYNTGKPKWSLVHFKSLEPLVRVLEHGSKKYAPFNWMKPFSKDELKESMMRHMVAIMDGEEIDKESGEPHIGHLMCNCLFYSYHFVIKKDEAKQAGKLD